MVLNHTRLQVYLSFSAGTMLGAAFFHMIPEAVRVGSAGTVRWTAVGLLALFFLERFFSFHHHEARTSRRRRDRSADRRVGHHGRARSMASRASARAPSQPQAPCAGVRRRSGWPCIPWREASRWPARSPPISGSVTARHGGRPRRLHRDPGPQAGRCPDHHRPDAPSGRPRRYTHLVNLGFALMIPAGVALFWIGTRGCSPVLARLVDGRAPWRSRRGPSSASRLSDLLPELQFHSHDRFKLPSPSWPGSP